MAFGLNVTNDNNFVQIDSISPAYAILATGIVSLSGGIGTLPTYNPATEVMFIGIPQAQFGSWYLASSGGEFGASMDSTQITSFEYMILKAVNLMTTPATSFGLIVNGADGGLCYHSEFQGVTYVGRLSTATDSALVFTLPTSTKTRFINFDIFRETGWVSTYNSPALEDVYTTITAFYQTNATSIGFNFQYTSANTYQNTVSTGSLGNLYTGGNFTGSIAQYPLTITILEKI